MLGTSNMKRDCLLIDADILIYRSAAINQTAIDWDGDGNLSIDTDLESAMDFIRDAVADLRRTFRNPIIYMCLSDPDRNWRKSVLPTYKSNRKDVAKPELIPVLRRWVKSIYMYKQVALLEADDVMGILSTKKDFMPSCRKVIVSQDKDMKTIPGWLFNPDKQKKATRISKVKAEYNWLYQTLTGDTTDGYKGCPGIGPIKAERFLNEDPTWFTVTWVFHQADLTEDDALVQARVARILRADDYDFINKEVILWEPK